MPVLHYRDGDRFLLLNIGSLLIIDIYTGCTAVRKVCLVTLLRKIRIGVRYFFQRHIQSFQHILIVRCGHNVMGLGVKRGDRTENLRIIRNIAQQHINLPALQIGIQISVKELVLVIIFDGTVNGIALYELFQPADIFPGIFIYADGLAVHALPVICSDAAVIPACQDQRLTVTGIIIRIGKVLLHPFQIVGAPHQIIFTGHEIIYHFFAGHIDIFIFPSGIFCNFIQIVYHNSVAYSIRICLGESIHLRKCHLQNPLLRIFPRPNRIAWQKKHQK